MADVSYPNGIQFRVGALEKRVDKIEELEPAVQSERIKNLTAEVRAMKRALYTFGFSILTGVVGFSFTVFALLGHH